MYDSIQAFLFEKINKCGMRYDGMSIRNVVCVCVYWLLGRSFKPIVRRTQKMALTYLSSILISEIEFNIQSETHQYIDNFNNHEKCSIAKRSVPKIGAVESNTPQVFVRRPSCASRSSHMSCYTYEEFYTWKSNWRCKPQNMKSSSRTGLFRFIIIIE